MTITPDDPGPLGIEYALTFRRMKAGETLRLMPDDRVVQADWDDNGKWCHLTILRRIGI